MAKDVSGLNYETVYNDIPYHIKERVGFPLNSYSLTSDQVRFFIEMHSAMSRIVGESIEEEKENIRQLAQEMSDICNHILKDK